MRRVALATLAHDWLRTSLLILGLAAAWSLVTVQLGLQRGFEQSARAILDHAGGDLWVSARGVRVIDDGEPVGLFTKNNACIQAARQIIVDYTQTRRRDGSLVTVQVVAMDAPSRGRLPWAVTNGSADNLAGPSAAGIDEADANKLDVDAKLGATLELRTGERLSISLLTRGARSFTQTPYVFTDIATARQMLSLPPESATFWILDLSPTCNANAVAADLRRRSSSENVTSKESLASSTVAHWIEGSGIGALLAIGTIIAALVGGAALVQSMITIVRTHTKEIATIRALGASRRELTAFVAWQVGTIASVSLVLALVLAMGIARSLRASGMTVVVDTRTWLIGAAIALVSTLVVAIAGARLLARVDPHEVLE